MRGFIITFDALIAISFFFIAILLISNSDFQLQSAQSVYLKQVSLDLLSVMDRSGRMSGIFNGNSSAVREVLQSTPDSLCFEMQVNTASGAQVATLSKIGCNGYSSELQTTYKTWEYANQTYIVSLYSWYTK